MSMAVNSESQVYSGATLENSEMGGRDTSPLASYLDAFYFLRII